MRFFDSHCHIDDPVFTKDMKAVLNRAAEAGVTAMMIAGVTGSTSETAVALAEKHTGVFASVGVHPHDAKSCTEDQIHDLIRLADSPKVKAWGETGLDFNRMFSPQKVQEHWFLRQIEAADALGLPLIFHERDTNGRFLQLLTAHHRPGRSGVVHCFSGNDKELSAYLDLGYYIGITGILTMMERGEKLREQVKSIPLDRMVIETDAPYLTPAPQKNRTRRNEPAFVPQVHTVLAEVLACDPAELADTLFENTCRLFRIPVAESPRT